MRIVGLTMVVASCVSTALFSVSSCAIVDSGSKGMNQETLPQDDDEDLSEADVKAQASWNNVFASDLFAVVSKANRDANVFISPYSVSSALAMAYAGARGTSERQMRQFLNLRGGQEKTHELMSSLQKELVADQEEDGYALLIANRIWAQDNFPWRDEFLSLNSDHYEAGFKAMDFLDDPEGSRQAINDWVSEQTAERIENLLAEGSIENNTRMVITNAVYFHGSWLSPFNEDSTKEKDFFVDDETTETVAMMRQKNNFPYFNDESLKAQIISLPYTTESLKSASMVVLLPNEGVTLAELSAKIKQNKLNEINTALASADFPKVNLELPKWRVEADYKLKQPLTELGMTDMFEENYADFSGMADLSQADNIYISEVVHKTFIDVSEAGTEAAAATAVLVAVRASAQPETPIDFHVNRPFMYYIVDDETGAILFMGSVTNPAK